MIDLTEIMTADDVAAILPFERSTIINYAQRGILPGRKCGKHWIFIASELAEAIERLPRGGDPSS